MGRSFSEAFPVARQTFEEVDDELGFPLSSLIFDGPFEELTLTKHCQIAIYAVSMAIWRVVQDQFSVPLSSMMAAGLSLGEYTALTASGKLSFRDGVELVSARGLYMHESSIKYPGTMAACLGMELDRVRPVIEDIEGVWIANLNYPGQVVVSGTLAGVERAGSMLKNMGARRFVPLDVSGAFHSGLMGEAQDRLREQIEAVRLYSTPCLLVMNASGDFVASEENMRQHLIDQMTSPVYWGVGICKMEEKGVDLFIEMGCGKTLSNMNRKIGVSATTLSIERVEDLETLNRTHLF